MVSRRAAQCLTTIVVVAPPSGFHRSAREKTWRSPKDRSVSLSKRSYSLLHFHAGKPQS